jgi:AcrR family transcriptional regulator
MAKPYHHGNLREALIDVGTALATEGGPEAVTIREAARRTGVSANAAYRHFEDLNDLLAEVSVRARSQLARSMEAELARMPKRRSDADRAREQLSAVGRGYIRFALRSPHLFRSAWAVCTKPDTEPSSRRLLEDAVEACVQAGVLPRSEFQVMCATAWAVVEGFSELALRGLLGPVDEKALGALGDQVLETFHRGLGNRKG